MKKYFVLLTMLFCLSSQVFGTTKCFIVQENEKILIQEGDCDSRHAPCSTFKIALALMGFDSCLLTDEIHPQLDFKQGYVDYIESWKQPHNPTTWIKNTCIWYSQVLTQKLGMEKFQEYVTKFKYGNLDISGDTGQNNGLTNCWLSSSLRISGLEQLKFLQDLLGNKLPISKKAQELTRNILFVENLPNGWELYGKMGYGSLPNSDRKIGWFVGWIEKENRKVVFVHYIEDDQKMPTHAGPRAREIAKERVLKLL